MTANKTKYLIILSGPTAVGKTSFAIETAQRYNSHIFSCDSRQIYQEINIGTAKPTRDELNQVKHYFIGNISIHKEFTAGHYQRAMDDQLKSYFETNSIGILTGGTGLYIRAIIRGLDEFPHVSKNILDDLEQKFRNFGLEPLVQQLTDLDPHIMSNIDINNSRRVIRALSVCLASGAPYSSFLANKEKTLLYTPIFITLTRDREELYQRINMRVDQMLAQGLVEEAQSLYHLRDLKALQTVGYSELFTYFDGKSTFDEAIELIKRNSRRYAKRQLTWFRNQEDFKHFPIADKDSIYDYIDGFIT